MKGIEALLRALDGRTTRTPLALAIARELHIPTVIVPLFPAHFSALGMIVADERHDLIRTHFTDLSLLDFDKLIVVYKEMGLVAQVFNEATLESLTGHLAIGHTRYSTTGASVWANAQPTFRSTATGHLALAHNGNLINAQVLRNELEAYGAIFQSTSDSEVIIHLIAHSKAGSFLARVTDALNQVRGAFSVVLLTDNGLIAARAIGAYRKIG